MVPAESIAGGGGKGRAPAAEAAGPPTRGREPREGAIRNDKPNVNDTDTIRERRLVFYKDDIDRINAVLKEFLSLSDSKCNLLIDKEGHMVTKVGATEDFDIQTVSALVAGSYAATRAMARLLGEEEFSVLFHQGRRDSIQLTLVGDRTILATVFDERTTIGMVRLYAKQAGEKLEKLFADMARREGKDDPDIAHDFAQTARQQMDSLLPD